MVNAACAFVRNPGAIAAIPIATAAAIANIFPMFMTFAIHDTDEMAIRLLSINYG
jgi:hypothetical protein